LGGSAENTTFLSNLERSNPPQSPHLLNTTLPLVFTFQQIHGCGGIAYLFFPGRKKYMEKEKNILKIQ